MKNLVKWIESKIKKLHWYDIDLIKLATFCVTLLVAKSFPAILSLDIFFYVAAALIASLIPLRLIFRKK